MSSPPVKALSARAVAEQLPGIEVLDLRTPAEVNGECLNDCMKLPVQDLTPASFKSTTQHLDQNTEVYLLCQSGKRAQMAVDKLQGQTERPLVIIEGGLNALKEAGVEVHTGTGKTISLERQVRIAAGFLVVVGVILGVAISPYFVGLSAFVGAGLMFAGITDTCAMGMVLARMPWNKA